MTTLKVNNIQEYTTSNVTGFYGRTGNVVLKRDDFVVVGGINTTGAAVSMGNVLVSGVTTSLTSINTPFYTNPSTITSSYTVPSNQNSFTAGPIGINTGVTVAVSSGSYWKVI